MNHPEIILDAFRDELEKISGMVRLGKTPVTVANALKGKGKFFKGLKEVHAAATPGMRFGPQAIGAATLSGAALGVYGQHKAKKLYNDYQTGKAMRQQAEGQG
jgi:hypothetical protein